MESEEKRDVVALQNAVQYWMGEAARFRAGWSDAEAQIAVLQDKLNWANVELAHRVGWEERMQKIQALVDAQAEDDALWLLEPSIGEAYLQQELRRLHEVIETP